MADQDWKRGPLNRQKYVIRKPCGNCGGSGQVRIRNAYGEIVDTLGCGLCRGTGEIPCSPNAAYFVLRIDCDETTGEPKDPHARIALAAYADSVASANPEFAQGIREWLEETGPSVPVPVPARSRSYFNGKRNREEAWLFYHEPSNSWIVIAPCYFRQFDGYEQAEHKYEVCVNEIVSRDEIREQREREQAQAVDGDGKDGG